MRIYASTHGAFLEPASAEIGVKEAVSVLQLEAQSEEETPLLRELYHTLIRGGVVHIIQEANSIRMVCEPHEPEKTSKAPVVDDPIGNSVREGFVSNLRPTTPETETVPSDPKMHRHRFASEYGEVINNTEIWLKCACGEWAEFERISMEKRLSSQGKKNKVVIH